MGISKLEESRDLYLKYFNTFLFKRKLNKATEKIKFELGKHKKVYIAYSTGKDSLCLLDLVYSIDKNINVMYHDSGVELPESKNVLSKITKDLNLKLNILKNPFNVINIYKEKQGLQNLGNKDIAFTKCMGNIIREWSERNDYDLSYIGLRKEESKKRKILLRNMGNYFYCKKYQIHQSYPLSDWKGMDIWAYIYGNNLEKYIHPAYHKDMFVNKPEDIRVSWYCDPCMSSHGYFLWIKYYYPEIFNFLKDSFPEVNSYV